MSGRIEYFDVGREPWGNGNTFDPRISLVQEEAKAASGFLPRLAVLSHSATFVVRLRTVTLIILEPQEEGGFVAKNPEYPGAVGEGETEEEAIKDLGEAIEAIEEELRENP